VPAGEELEIAVGQGAVGWIGEHGDEGGTRGGAVDLALGRDQKIRDGPTGQIGLKGRVRPRLRTRVSDRAETGVDAGDAEHDDHRNDDAAEVRSDRPPTATKAHLPSVGAVPAR